MVAVQKLYPYHIKADDNYIRVILDYQYFTLTVENELYQFVPLEAKEILIERRTKKIVNMDAMFSFQNDTYTIHIAMTELVLLPDFLIQLHNIAEPYYDKAYNENPAVTKKNIIVVDELEQSNVKRLIDQALDDRDEKAFYKLITLL